MPTSVVENQFAAASGHWWNLLCHRVEKDLENVAVAMRNDQTDELSSSWGNRTDHVLPDVFSEVSLSDPFSSLCPLSPGPRVTFKSRFVSEKQITALILNELEKIPGKALALIFPCFPIRRLRHRARNLELIIVLMEVSHQGAVRDDQILLCFQPTDKLGYRPMRFIRSRWIVQNREDDLGNRLLGNGSRSSRFWPIGQSVDPLFIESRDPELKASFTDYRMLLSQFEVTTAKHQMDRAKTILSLPIRATINRKFQLSEGTVFRIWVLSLPSDP